VLLQLGQVTVIAQQYISARALPATATAVHFDSGSAMILPRFEETVTKASQHDARDMVVLNFDAELAHGRPVTQRNGWGVMSDVDPKAESLSFYDTAPTHENSRRAIDGNAHELAAATIDISVIFSAMCVKDVTTNRARGILHIRRRAVSRDCAADDSETESASFSGQGESAATSATDNWHAMWTVPRRAVCGAISRGVSSSATSSHGMPCHGLTALAMGLTLLDDAPGRVHTVDAMAQLLGLSSSAAALWRGWTELPELAARAAAYTRALSPPSLQIEVELLHFDVGAATQQEWVAELQRVQAVRASERETARATAAAVPDSRSGGSEGAGAGMMHAEELSEVHVLCFDLDRAHGCQTGLANSEVRSHTALLVDYVDDELVMADPHPARYGMLWATSPDLAYSALTARSPNGRAHGLLRLTRAGRNQEAPPSSLRTRRLDSEGPLTYTA
jgi:hypothetical protein